MTVDPLLASSNPLLAIERAVLDRAKSAGINLDREGAAAALETLVREEVQQWRHDYERGVLSFELADPATTTQRVLHDLLGYGPLDSLMEDDDVYEIMINSPDSVFVKRHSGMNGYHHEVFHDDDHVQRTMVKILDDATASGGPMRKLDPSEGLQDAQLQNGSRLHLVHGDIARGGHLIVNIRKFVGLRYKSLRELVTLGMLDQPVADVLRALVSVPVTFVIAGAPGAGKTTLLSCLTAELDPSMRAVTAEEVFEVDIPLANVASMQTRPPRSDRKEIDLRRLVAGFLRMAPDVAIVGEVRDREALPLLLTLSSGVKGFTTLHAGSARQAMTRLRFIAQLADTSNEIPMAALNALIAEAVDVVVHIARTPDGVRVNEVVAVEEPTVGSEGTTFTITDLFRRPTPSSPLCWTGQVPTRLARALETKGISIIDLLDAVTPWPTTVGGKSSAAGRPVWSAS
jgi:pilus assembly protein CpaF